MTGGEPMKAYGLADFGVMLFEKRSHLGMSVRAAGADSGVPPGTFSRIERGATEPSVTTFYRLVNWLGMAPCQFSVLEEPDP